MVSHDVRERGKGQSEGMAHGEDLDFEVVPQKDSEQGKALIGLSYSQEWCVCGKHWNVGWEQEIRRPIQWNRLKKKVGGIRVGPWRG